MKDPRIINLVKEEAEKMYEEKGSLILWMLTRRIARSIGVSTEIIVRHLTGLGYVEIVQGAFVLRDDRESPIAKKIRSIEGTAFPFKVSDEIEQPAQDFIQQPAGEIDYSGYRVMELRSIASKKGIKLACTMKKKELLEEIKAKLK